MEEGPAFHFAHHGRQPVSAALLLRGRRRGGTCRGLGRPGRGRLDSTSAQSIHRLLRGSVNRRDHHHQPVLGRRRQEARERGCAYRSRIRPGSWLAHHSRRPASGRTALASHANAAGKHGVLAHLCPHSAHRHDVHDDIQHGRVHPALRGRLEAALLLPHRLLAREHRP